VNNFETHSRFSKFPTWYPQVILQIMIVIYALSFIPGLGSWGKRYLPYSVVALFLIFVAINRYLPHYLPGASEQLPHLQFWNFCLGWCFYFFSDPLSSPLRNRVAMLVILIAVVLLKFDFSTSIPFVLIGGAAILLFVKNVSLPAILSKAVTIIAAASFVIFLWHRFFFEVYKRLAHLPSHQGGLGMWLFGMIGSLLIWSLWESFERTWPKFARASAADPGRPRNPLGAMMRPFWARHSTQID
jgi:peptidoglycan/LPS O-acetylase OafA/YrhL